jgi:Holliday junction resolvasome RuvABC endonuclease subunit
MRCILGVDPGVTGGVAFYWPPGRVEAYDIPTAGGEVDVDSLARLLRHAAPDLAMVERSWAMPKQGVSSTFKFGMAYGALRAVVAVLEIPTHLTTAAKWKAHFRLTADKEQARALAIRLWPGVCFFSRKKDHGRAEAALIARYAAETLP